jgi:putative endonuclease
MKIYYVYILKCIDKTYYTGITSNLTKRIQDHHLGKHQDAYTFYGRPLQLVFFCEFTNVNMAITTENK